MRRRFFPTVNHPPPEPPSEPFAFFSINGTGHARTAARQTLLEPATGGVDRARSWTGWFIVHSYGNEAHRLFTNGEAASSIQQYSLNIVAADNQTGLSNHLQFVIFNTAMTTNISLISSQKILKNRLYFYAVTYSGNGSHTGLNLYLQAVNDTTATKSTSGAYTTAGNSANYRYQAGYVAGASTNQSFRGRHKNHAIWSTELTQLEVTELFNLEAASVSGASFYGAKVVAYWPMSADMVCFNSATFNFSSVTNIIFGSFPFSVDYRFITVFNGIAPNTRYVAFGSMYKKPSGKFSVKIRSGTSHVAGGKIVDLEFDPAGNMSVVAPTDVITDANDLRQAQAAITDGTNITVFSARFNDPNLLSQDYYVSTDGLTGLTFSARTDISSILPVGFGFGLTYGKVVPGYVAGEYFVAWYSGNVGGTSKIGLIKRSALGVYSYIPVYSGATTYGEPALLRAEDNTFVIMMRLVGGNKLFMTYSTDVGNTVWSAPAATNVGTGECMADLCMMPNTRNIILAYADRGTGAMTISTGNRLADILADPTDWNAGSDLFKRYSFAGGLNAILGYPCIVPDGYNVAGCVSAERTATVADLYFFYGQVDFV